VRVNVENGRIPRVLRGDPFEVEIDGQTLIAYQGETIAAVLLANGIRVFGHAEDGSPHGICCGIGRCFSCLVTVDGQPDIRACVTPASPGMCIETSKEGAGN